MINLAIVASEIPSISQPCLDTKRVNFFSFLAAHSGLLQRNTFVPDTSLTSTYASAPHTGHFSGICNVPSFFTTEITFGIILFALMTERTVPLSPIPSLSHSLILQREALLTVVPSSSTGSNTATGVIAEAAQDHSI